MVFHVKVTQGIFVVQRVASTLGPLCESLFRPRLLREKRLKYRYLEGNLC